MNDKSYPPLTTDLAEKMDKSCPWNVYPRPQLKRKSFFCLNGLWDFQITQSKEIPEAFTEKILVPFPVESQLSGIGRAVSKNDRLFYRRTFKLPRNFARDKILLRFGAIDRFAKVYFNGEVMGVHDCGYTPFFADITAVLRRSFAANVCSPLRKRKALPTSTVCSPLSQTSIPFCLLPMPPLLILTEKQCPSSVPNTGGRTVFFW